MKTLVCVGAGLGNIVETTPLISAMKELGHSVDVLVCSPREGAGEVIADKKRIGQVLVGKIEDFDLCSYDRILVTYFYAMPVAKETVDGRFLFSKKEAEINVEFQTRNEVEVNMDLSRMCGYDGQTPPTWCAMSDKGFEQVDWIALSPGNLTSRWRLRCWDKFVDLALKLQEQGEKILFVGSEHDKFADTQIFDNVFQSYIGKLSITETAKLISQCKVFVGNDGGLMHIANAVGTKTFGIFGPAGIIKSMVVGITPISKKLPCQPCLFTPNFRESKCTSVRCMSELSVLDVLKVINEEDRNGL